MSVTVDLAVVGGGINGCGIARDAAGRGLKVFLCEQGDLASATSSASTKLIHGGLRYLEHLHFRLVRESLIEREVLLRVAPHIVHPLRFVLPHEPSLRPVWQIRLGLFLYDHLGGRRLLPGTRSLRLRNDEAGTPLKPEFRVAFEYSDCWVDDARLVVLNAVDAAARGAMVRTRTRCVRAERTGAVWRLTCENTGTGVRESVEAKALVNAAGPWVAQFLTEAVQQRAASKVRLVKGSHIVVRRLFDHARAYIFQNGDGRIIFAIPYQNDFTLLGTTDSDYSGDPSQVRASPEDIDYICSAANEYFKRPVSPRDVVWTYSGVRPLYDDGASKAQEATRDYVLEVDASPGAPAFVSIFGGKITTYRRLAEAVLERLNSSLPMEGPWTAHAALPGGDFPHDGLDRRIADLMQSLPWLTHGHAQRWVRAYGTKVQALLSGIRTRADLGRHFGADLYEREVQYLMDREWALQAEDVLWRRSKVGLRMTQGEVDALSEWMRARAEAQRTPAA